MAAVCSNFSSAVSTTRDRQQHGLNLRAAPRPTTLSAVDVAAFADSADLHSPACVGRIESRLLSLPPKRRAVISGTALCSSQRPHRPPVWTWYARSDVSTTTSGSHWAGKFLTPAVRHPPRSPLPGDSATLLSCSILFSVASVDNCPALLSAGAR